MTKAQKAATARRNGAKSKGPKTAAGKAATSRNALKHGRYASRALEAAAARAVATHEDKEQFLRLVRRNLAELQTASPIERDIAIALADNQWRYERWNTAETLLLNFERRALESDFQELFDEGSEDFDCPLERHARAAKAFAIRSDFLTRITAERSRLLRERAQHFRLLRTLRKEFPKTPEQTKEQTKEQTNVLNFRTPVTR